MAARRLLCAAALLAALGAAPPAAAEAPLSAIDWLSDSIALPSATQPPDAAPPLDEPPVSLNALPDPVTVQPLDAPNPDLIGLEPAGRSALPADLWAGSHTDALVRKLRTDRSHALPATRRLYRDMLTLRAAAPADSDGSIDFLLARIDGLLDLGALDAARRMLLRAGRAEPRLFRRQFDIALLTRTAGRACRRMLDSPEISPTYAARIFCLARGGDWNAAALTLETASALSILPPDQRDLLDRFLDDSAPPPLTPPPRDPSPLQFAILEAVGAPMSTAPLPLAFAHADLGGGSGWKARIEAAERLTGAGAMTPGRLWEIYAEREPAASGGLWDRVAAAQAFEAAIGSGDAKAVSRRLPDVWRHMRLAGLDFAFATRYGAELATLPLSGPARSIALRAALLSPARARLDETLAPTTDDERFLVALSRGTLGEAPLPDETARALAEGFAATSGPARLADLAAQGRHGEALLGALDLFEAGEAGNLDALRDGIAHLRAAGLERVGIEAALQLMILERRG